MEKLKEYKYIIIIVLIILGLVFYWFEWRPSRIMIKCNDLALWQASARTYREDMDRVHGETFQYSQKEYEHYFSICLKNKGLEK
mgnify:CR=1 FL=1